MIGKVIKGTYRVLEELGRGTMSTAYLVRDTAHDEPVNIRSKILPVMLSPSITLRINSAKHLVLGL